MKQGLAIIGAIVVIYAISEVNPKAAALVAAIVGILLYAQLPKEGVQPS